MLITKLFTLRDYLQRLCVVANYELVLAKGGWLMLSVVLCTEGLLIRALTDATLRV